MSNPYLKPLQPPGWTLTRSPPMAGSTPSWAMNFLTSTPATGVRVMRTSGVLVVLTGPTEVLAGTRACDDQSSNICPSGQIRSRNPRGSIRRHRRRGRGPPSLRTLRAERAGDPRKGECCDRQKDKPRDQLAKDDLPDTELGGGYQGGLRQPVPDRENYLWRAGPWGFPSGHRSIRLLVDCPLVPLRWF